MNSRESKLPPPKYSPQEKGVNKALFLGGVALGGVARIPMMNGFEFFVHGFFFGTDKNINNILNLMNNFNRYPGVTRCWFESCLISILVWGDDPI